MSNGTKKSDFSSLTTIPSGATFDYVINGTNYKIPIADMITAFGTTGVLSQLGEVTGIPVLSKVSLTNYIRNIVGGTGILTALSPEDGISIKHNFTADDTGAPMLTGVSDASPVIGSIVAGSGISVGAQGNAIQIALSATPVSNKTITVNTIADLPTAVSGVITLAADTQYLQLNDINIGTSRLVLQEDTVYSASDRTLITLTYTGTGALFTSAGHDNKVKDIALNAANGSLFDISGTGTGLFRVTDCGLTADVGGTVDTISVAIFQNCLWALTTDGMTFAGNTSIIAFSNNIGTLLAGSFIDLGVSTFDGFSFTESEGTLSAGSVFITGAADSANVNTGGLATVLNTRAKGLGTPLVGVDTSDALWEFFANNGIEDSINSLLAHNGGATVVIAATSTPVIIGATWDISQESRFTGTAAGRFTYTGKGAHVNLTASITVDIVSGTKKSCEFYFYKNGVKETNSGVQRDFTAGNAGNFSMVWQLGLDTGDYIEIFAENQDSTANLTIVNALLGIR